MDLRPCSLAPRFVQRSAHRFAHGPLRRFFQRSALIALATACLPGAEAAEHDLEYVAEHLPEAAANHRLASLPLWQPAPDSWSVALQGAYSRNSAADLTLAGPLAAISGQYRLAPRWTLAAFGFYDRLRFSGENDQRPLDVRFAGSVPLALPAQAEFASLGGRATIAGAGFALGYDIESGWLKDWRVTFGGAVQRLSLRDYATRYRLLDGPSAGATGLVDYSAGYTLLPGLLGISRRFDRGDWALVPHGLLVLPLARRGVQGRISGQGFDIRGDTADVGAGKHVGDPALAFGLDLEYRPWRAWLDVGALLTQPLAEPAMHKGLDRSVLVSVGLRF